jgi:hypothetical protein
MVFKSNIMAAKSPKNYLLKPTLGDKSSEVAFLWPSTNGFPCKASSLMHRSSSHAASAIVRISKMQEE